MPTSRGFVWVVWNEAEERVSAALQRSMESVRKFHPDAGLHVVKTNGEHRLLEKAAGYLSSPFDLTIALDVDTELLRPVDHLFEVAAEYGVALRVNENPNAERFGCGKHVVEYNTGVIAFSKAGDAVLRRWAELCEEGKLDTSRPRDKKNDQAYFATAASEIRTVYPLRPTDNLRPSWETTFWGPVYIWHDWTPCSASLRAVNDTLHVNTRYSVVSYVEPEQHCEAFPEWWGVREKPVVTLIESKPRLAIAMHERCLRAAVIEAGIPTDRQIAIDGAFWERALDRGVMAAMEQGGSDYLLFTDMDSTFRPSDVPYLVDLMQSRRDLAAVFGVQAHRHLVLDQISRDPGADYANEVSVQHYGHFGLTLIRTEVFTRMPKPWFWSIPDPVTMGWKDMWQGADLFFWDRLRQCGGVAAQANGCILGHMEWMNYWADPVTGTTTVQPVNVAHPYRKPSRIIELESRFRDGRGRRKAEGVSDGGAGV